MSNVYKFPTDNQYSFKERCTFKERVKKVYFLLRIITKGIKSNDRGNALTNLNRAIVILHDLDLRSDKGLLISLIFIRDSLKVNFNNKKCKTISMRILLDYSEELQDWG